MTTALISDIHGNWEALTSVLADIDRRGIERVVCLGDVVGYGPEPARCLDLVRARCAHVLMGNHEDALLHGPIGFYPLARNALLWTRAQMFSPVLHPLRTMRYRRILRHLPRALPLENCWLVHGSPRDPTNEYLLEREFLFGAAAVLDELFAFAPPVCFAGHTHIPGVFGSDRQFRRGGEDGGEVPLGEHKLIINIGSVGQPRDRDPRACYVEFSDDRVVYHRVAYPIEAVQAKCLARGLDPWLAERLALGV